MQAAAAAGRLTAKNRSASAATTPPVRLRQEVQALPRAACAELSSVAAGGEGCRGPSRLRPLTQPSDPRAPAPPLRFIARADRSAILPLMKHPRRRRRHPRCAGPCTAGPTHRRATSPACGIPGGKVESGEAPASALARIARGARDRGRPGAPVIRVPQRYPDKRLVLDVHESRIAARRAGWKARPWPGWPRPTCRLSDAARGPARGRGAAAARAVPGHPGTDRRGVVARRPGSGAGRWRPAGAAARAGAGMPRSGAAGGRCGRTLPRGGADVLVNGDAALAIRSRVGLHLRAAQLNEAGIAAAIARVRAGRDGRGILP